MLENLRWNPKLIYSGHVLEYYHDVINDVAVHFIYYSKQDWKKFYVERI